MPKLPRKPAALPLNAILAQSTEVELKKREFCQRTVRLSPCPAAAPETHASPPGCSRRCVPDLTVCYNPQRHWPLSTARLRINLCLSPKRSRWSIPFKFTFIPSALFVQAGSTGRRELVNDGGVFAPRKSSITTRFWWNQKSRVQIKMGRTYTTKYISRLCKLACTFAIEDGMDVLWGFQTDASRGGTGGTGGIGIEVGGKGGTGKGPVIILSRFRPITPASHRGHEDGEGHVNEFIAGSPKP
ncbi:hypothetical protein B0H14DRAFT_2651218 [Mycena olivaceomarginata]|nr:hypothetical protein B0H14DRAFT_2651218 [Mycena olivaceomarginata]